MNEQLMKLINDVKNNEELRGKLAGCKSLDDALEAARDFAGDFTKEELGEALAGVISSDKLGAIAGGVGKADISKMAGEALNFIKNK